MIRSRHQAKNPSKPSSKSVEGFGVSNRGATVWNGDVVLPSQCSSRAVTAPSRAILTSHFGWAFARSQGKAKGIIKYGVYELHVNSVMTEIWSKLYKVVIFPVLNNAHFEVNFQKQADSLIFHNACRFPLSRSVCEFGSWLCKTWQSPDAPENGQSDLWPGLDIWGILWLGTC